MFINKKIKPEYLHTLHPARRDEQSDYSHTSVAQALNNLTTVTPVLHKIAWTPGAVDFAMDSEFCVLEPVQASFTPGQTKNPQP